MPEKALSIRAPWWWFILHAGKDVENRDWPTNFRGTVYVHASKWWKHFDIEQDVSSTAAMLDDRDIRVGKTLRTSDMRPFGGCIVGTVDIVGCVRESRSPWFFWDYGFVLAKPIAFANPIPCKGALGLFTQPTDVLSQLRADPVPSATEVESEVE